MPAPLPISVVIPTYNRKDSLLRTLAGLESQSLASSQFEAVIVDDGSSDQTAAAVRARRFSFALTLVEQANGGPAKARNRGIETARGEFVLFIDDDIEPAADLLAVHLARHEEAERDRVVIGPLSSLPHYAQPWVAWEQAKLEKQYEEMLNGVYPATFRQFWTGNASVRRSHLVELGGFNTDYLRGEDVELGRRLHQRGLEFFFDIHAVGLHHAQRSLDSWMNAHSHYGRLEVDTMSGLGEWQLIEILAGNYGRLHVATRTALSMTRGRPRARATLVRALRTLLLSPASRVSAMAASRACSVLANLLYWEGSEQELGRERFDQVLARADVVRSLGPEARFTPK